MAGFGGDPTVSLLGGLAGGMLKGEEEKRRREQEAFLNQLRMAAEGRAKSAERRAEEDQAQRRTTFQQGQTEYQRKEAERAAIIEEFKSIADTPEEVAILNERGYTRERIAAIQALGDPELMKQIMTDPYVDLATKDKQQIDSHIRVSEGTLAADTAREAAMTEARERVQARFRPATGDTGAGLTKWAEGLTDAEFQAQYGRAVQAATRAENGVGPPLSPEERAAYQALEREKMRRYENRLDLQGKELLNTQRQRNITEPD